MRAQAARLCDGESAGAVSHPRRSAAVRRSTLAMLETLIRDLLLTPTDEIHRWLRSQTLMLSTAWRDALAAGGTGWQQHSLTIHNPGRLLACHRLR